MNRFILNDHCMKRFIFYCFISLVFLCCAKEHISSYAPASLSIVNAVAGGGTLLTNFNGTAPILYQSAQRLEYGTFNMFNNRFSIAGRQPLAIYSLADTTDKSSPLFSFVLDYPAGSINTLFLAGTKEKTDTLMLTDHLPEYADSVMGIRFLHLASGIGKVSVSLGGGAPAEQAVVAYRNFTPFNIYGVHSGMDNYIFQFRNEDSGELIASFETQELGNMELMSGNSWLRRNFTLALIGVAGESGITAPSVVCIPHHP